MKGTKQFKSVCKWVKRLRKLMTLSKNKVNTKNRLNQNLRKLTNKKQIKIISSLKLWLNHRKKKLICIKYKLVS